MDDVQLMQLAVFGFCTGLGTTFGAELAKATLEQFRKRIKPRSNVKRNEQTKS